MSWFKNQFAQNSPPTAEAARVILPGAESPFRKHPIPDRASPDPSQIGQLVPGKGILLCKNWEPDILTRFRSPDHRQHFNVYAAPQALEDRRKWTKRTAILTYTEAIKRVADLKDYHGYDGSGGSCSLGSEESVLSAIWGNLYKGQWFLPTKDLLNQLYQHKSTGSFKEIFKDKSEPTWYPRAPLNPPAYWCLISSYEYQPSAFDSMYLREGFSPDTGRLSLDHPRDVSGNLKFSVHVVRAEPCP
jgi:hypothetical protein